MSVKRRYRGGGPGGGQGKGADKGSGVFFDDDGDVDIEDYTALTQCFNGSNKPPSCNGLKPTQYVWDAENRLTEAKPLVPLAGDKWVKCEYDHMNRRVRKQVFGRNANNTAWLATSSEDWRFVWDGWNLVLVLDGRDGPDPGTEPDNTVVRKYTWGLDLSGLSGSSTSAGIHGAAGIGGLLAVTETGGTHAGSYWFLYDANGNVGQLVKASDQTTAARYEYDPYGNVIGPDPDADGDWQEHATTYALANPIRFSTRWFDPETGAGCWLRRYYLPRIGRWMSRDPIGERGGKNLYLFTGNDAVVRVDPKGLDFSMYCPACYKQELPRGCGSCWQTCLDNQQLAPPVIDPIEHKVIGKAFGFVICRGDGCKCACLNMKELASMPRDYATAAIAECALKHEEKHISLGIAKCPSPGWFTSCDKAIGITKNFDESNAQKDECAADAVGINCLFGKLGGCGDTECRARIIEAMEAFKGQCSMLEGDVFQYGAQPEPWE